MRAYDPRSYWSNVADAIAERSAGDVVAGDENPVSRYRRQRFLDRFLRAMPVGGKSVLEVGCGPGGNLRELSWAGPSRLAGCDLSSAMLELARQNTAELDAVELHEVDGRTLPFADREFDLVCTVTVLHHNQDRQMRSLLGEMCRVAGDAVVLVEDTASRRREFYSYVAAPVSRYSEVCVEHGFELADATVLPIAASEVLARVLRLLFRSSSHPEGQPIGRVHRASEGFGLALSRHLDKHITPHRGLTRMTFRRRDPGA